MERYRYLKELGCGGSGRTFLVWDNHIGCKRVLKRIAAYRMEEGQSLAACRELAALRQIRQEGVPMLTDAWQEADTLCLVMEYIEGVTLEERVLKEGVLTEQEALLCALQIASLLRILHELPGTLIHGDVKPQNLICRRKGIALLDFGGAAWFHSPERFLAHYTKGYGAPELKAGLPLSEQSDVYALGAVLFFMVMGEHPDDMRGIYPVREQNPFLSRELEEMILWCTHPQQEYRCRSMRSVQEKILLLQKGAGRRSTRKRGETFRCVKNILLMERLEGES